MQIEIQIVDTHKCLETRIVIGLQAFGYQISRALLMSMSVQWKMADTQYLNYAYFPKRQASCNQTDDEVRFRGKPEAKKGRFRDLVKQH